jgi:WD40 repeat protein
MTGVPESPYKGLAAFEDSELDALLFFGREREIEAVAANVLASRLTVLYGPSGVGKSSLLGAGVARRLRELSGAPVVVHDSWAEDPEGGLIASVRAECGGLGPTAGLVDTIAAAAQQSGEIHLLLDQFEEYVLYHGVDGPLTTALPELLRRPGLRVNVLLAIRDDALAELDEFTGRIPELFANLLRLDRLDREEGRAAIVGPLERYSELAGARFTAEEALVEAVLDEAETESGVEAPYLQLVLERLWEREREAGSNELRLRTFRAIGGSRAIVREHVHGALGQLSVVEQEAASRIVRQLVTPSGRKVSHEAGDLAEYAEVEPAQLQALLEQLGRRRIVRGVNGTPGAPTRYEIFHDVLGPPILAWQHEHQLRRERERARRQRRRLRMIVAATAVALLVVAGIAAYALSQRSDARSAADRARGRELAARALADLATNPQTSVQLALQAAQLAPGRQTASVLRSSLLAMREEKIIRLGGTIVAASFAPRGGDLLLASSNGRLDTYLDGRLSTVLPGGPAVTAAVWSSDGQRFAAGLANGTVRVWGQGVPTGSAIHTPSSVTALGFEQNTLLIASGADVRLADLARGGVKTIRFTGTVEAAALDPNASVFAVAFRHGKTTRAELVDARSGRTIRRLPEDGIHSFAFSPNGRLLASGSNDLTARLWNAQTGRLLHVLPHRGYVLEETFSRDGRSLVTSSSDGAAYVWDVATGQRELLLVGATGAMEAAAFSPDGSEIATASADKLARIYYSQDGRLLAPLAGAANSVTSIGFDPSGRTIVTGSSDGTVRLWDAQPAGTLTTIDKRKAPVRSFWAGGHAVSVAGTVVRILSTSGRVLRTAKLRAPATLIATNGHAMAFAGGGYLTELSPTGTRKEHLPGLSAIAFAGKQLLLGSSGNGIGVVESGPRRHVRVAGPVLGLSAGDDRFLVRLPHELLVYTDAYQLVSTIHTTADRAVLSPGGLGVATAQGKIAQVWDATTGRLLHTLGGHTSPITDVEYSPNGLEVVTTSYDHTGLVFAARSGRLVHRLIGHFFPVYSGAFSPNGRWIVTASQFTAGLWDAATGQLMLYLGRTAAPLTGASFNPSGNWILTGSADGTARVYNCQICEPLSGLESLARRRLSALR